ncbi:MAG: hypothetical protein Q8Q80_16635 [Methyloversatilis sp.]|uniref:hypothetical protein n=1 Tax=Methyloversatilis sp. TaxID=2569862 RepID=UPI0027374815|nr:hypothetical protein [Methyloversatilis sp.]MDP3874288.1 hypothetical protein [Methyloversatilis sp.]
MANLTLVIDDEVLQKARIRAASEGTSVNAVVREQIARYASGREARLRALAELDALVDRLQPSSGDGWTFDRNDIYEERMSRHGPAREQ